MRSVIQRVKKASVKVENEITGEIKNGLLVFLGVTHDDNEEDIKWISEKIVNLRIFEDIEGKMNKSLLENGGGILIVSQFTLFGDCRKGRRPSFTQSAKPEKAKEYYDKTINFLRKTYPQLNLQTGIFQAEMEVDILNDGPVTLLLDSKKLF